VLTVPTVGVVKEADVPVVPLVVLAVVCDSVVNVVGVVTLSKTHTHNSGDKKKQNTLQKMTMWGLLQTSANGMRLDLRNVAYSKIWPMSFPSGSDLQLTTDVNYYTENGLQNSELLYSEMISNNLEDKFVKESRQDAISSVILC